MIIIFVSFAKGGDEFTPLYLKISKKWNVKISLEEKNIKKKWRKVKISPNCKILHSSTFFI